MATKNSQLQLKQYEIDSTVICDVCFTNEKRFGVSVFVWHWRRTHDSFIVETKDSIANTFGVTVIPSLAVESHLRHGVF